MEEVKQESEKIYSAGPVSLTARAVEMVKKAIQEEGLQEHGLRVAVQGGGCSGLQYVLDFENKPRTGDLIADADGVQVYVDFASANLLRGTVVDYVKGLNGAGFKFENPNARRTCGCGHSFS